LWWKKNGGGIIKSRQLEKGQTQATNLGTQEKKRVATRKRKPPYTSKRVANDELRKTQTEVGGALLYERKSRKSMVEGPASGIERNVDTDPKDKTK